MKENCKFNPIAEGPSTLVTLSKSYSFIQGMEKGKHDLIGISVFK